MNGVAKPEIKKKSAKIIPESDYQLLKNFVLDEQYDLRERLVLGLFIDCCTIILIPVSLKCGDTGVIYRLSFLSIRQRLSRWRLIRSRNTIVERTEEIPSATGSAKKAAFAPKKEGRTAALITKRDFLVTESASPVFGHSRAVSPSTKTYWNWSGRACSEEGHQDPVHRHQCR